MLVAAQKDAEAFETAAGATCVGAAETVERGEQELALQKAEYERRSLKRRPAPKRWTVSKQRTGRRPAQGSTIRLLTEQRLQKGSKSARLRASQRKNPLKVKIAG